MDSQVGELLRVCRTVKGLSARQLSLASGLSESVVGKVESCSIEPSLRVFSAIVRELGLTDREIAYLVRLSAASSRDMPSTTGR